MLGDVGEMGRLFYGCQDIWFLMLFMSAWTWNGALWGGFFGTKRLKQTPKSAHTTQNGQAPSLIFDSLTLISD